jgi:hypothetical protein
MKHLKYFESVNDGEPKVGDYVIVDRKTELDVYDFTSNNIGYYEQSVNSNRMTYHIRFNNVPEELEKKFTYNCRNYSREDIKYWSKNKKELEIILSTIKYNI